MYSTRSVEEGGTTPDASTILPPSAEVSVDSSVEPSPGPTTPSSPPESNTTATTPSQSISNSFLFASIYGRCGDISASVRAQALNTLGEITGEQADSVKEVLDTIFAQDKASRGPLSLTDVLKDPNMDLPNLDFLPSGDELIQFLRRRALDQSVFVKKSAFQVLENILQTSDTLMAEDLVSVLAEHCRDSNLALRKQMVISLTEQVKTYPDMSSLVSTWVQNQPHGLLPGHGLQHLGQGGQAKQHPPVLHWYGAQWSNIDVARPHLRPSALQGPPHGHGATACRSPRRTSSSTSPLWRRRS